MKTILLCSLVLLWGCRQEKRLFNEKLTVASLTSEQKMCALRTEAKSRGIRWEIICIPKSDHREQTYQADAFQQGDNDERSRYVEDGAKDWWAETASTPEDAAYLLSQSIQHAPNIGADHRPLPTPTGDCNYNRVFDSEHGGAIPCGHKP